MTATASTRRMRRDVASDDYLEDFLAGYLECAVWASTDAPPDATGDDPEPEPLDDQGYTTDDIDPHSMARMRADCARFIAEAFSDLAAHADAEADSGVLVGRQRTSAQQAGHDFWLTRNGHGVGFWDRGMGELGERLSEAAKLYGEAHLLIADDGTLDYLA